MISRDPILLMILALAVARACVPLGGEEGEEMLMNLTGNLSIRIASPDHTVNISGDGSDRILENLTADILSSDRSNSTTGDLWGWGSEPRETPPPPRYDPRQAEMNEVLRQNHLGY